MGTFRCKKTMYNGVMYDSKTEAQAAEVLDMLLGKGKIAKVERQVSYQMPTFKNVFEKGRKKPWSGRYMVDFRVEKNNGEEVLLEIKGSFSPNAVRNGAALWKYALFMYIYEKKIHVIEAKDLEENIISTLK